MGHARRFSLGRTVFGLVAAFSCAAAPVASLAQSGPVRTVDPNDVAIDSDLAPVPQDDRGAPPPYTPPAASAPAPYDPAAPAAQPAASARTDAVDSATTYQKDDLIAAGEGVFGKGAEGLAAMIEKILKDQGQPTAYIAGREAGASIGVGLRYGSGELFHKVEGKRKVYWTGPSIGFDLGANAAKTFVLVYNLYDSQDIYKRFPAGEGALYFIGGLHASYLRRGDIVLIPIRLGVGWRAGINAGYMKITEKSRIIPF